MKHYVKTPTIYQMEATECGAASLAMVFAYYGKYIPLEQMRVETGVSRDGCDAGHLMEAGEKFGFEVHGYKKEPQELKNLRLPCIIHWNFNHFVVLEGFHGKYVYINDPAQGRRRLTAEEFDDCFTGVVLTFHPAGEFQKEKKKNTTIPFLRQRLSGNNKSVLALILIGILTAVPGILIPVLSQGFLDQVLIGRDHTWYAQLLLGISCMIVLQGGLSIYRNILLYRLQKKMVLLSAREFLEKLIRLPLNFFEQRYSGDIANRVTANASVSDFLAGDLAQTVLDFLVAFFYLVLLFLYSPLLAGIAVLSVIAELAIVQLFSSRIRQQALKLQQDSGKLAGAIYAGLSISDTLKASGAENEYVSRILGYDAKVNSLNQQFGRSQFILDAFPGAIRMLTDVLLLLTGGFLVIRGQMTIGMLVAFTTLFGSFHEPVDHLAGFVKRFQTTKADISRVEDIMNYAPDPVLDGKEQVSSATSRLEGSVRVEGLSFGYSPIQPPVVHDLNFQVPCGSSVAVVGPTGCGKSTIARVISGLYQPWTGQVYFDDIPASRISEQVRCASIATVSQDVVLFSGTVRENLTMWNANIKEEDMIAAAKDACIHDVISSKPGAYDYHIAEGAGNLSGGQRQRMEIARALATNPTILILDEATSALDPIVEKQILDNIKRRGCTCITIAHRLSAVRDCDRILVMENGRIVQQGSHAELVQQEGLYREFMNNR